MGKKGGRRGGGNKQAATVDLDSFLSKSNTKTTVQGANGDDWSKLNLGQ